MAVSTTQLKLTVFSDYICPFCYVGEPVSSLSYPVETWRRMMARLRQMAAEAVL